MLPFVDSTTHPLLLAPAFNQNGLSVKLPTSLLELNLFAAPGKSPEWLAKGVKFDGKPEQFPIPVFA